MPVISLEYLSRVLALSYPVSMIPASGNSFLISAFSVSWPLNSSSIIHTFVSKPHSRLSMVTTALVASTFTRSPVDIT